MPFSFECPSCQVEREASQKIIGRRVRCPECGHVSRVPDPRDAKKLSADDEFDPYMTWLEIPKEEQPPNHYRLLGAQVFEESVEVIEDSADQKMVHVKAQSSGRFAKQSQDLLNEMARARSCLLNPEKKREYDEQLRAQIEEQKKLDDLTPLEPTADPLKADELEPFDGDSGPAPVESAGGDPLGLDGLDPVGGDGEFVDMEMVDDQPLEADPLGALQTSVPQGAAPQTASMGEAPGEEREKNSSKFNGKKSKKKSEPYVLKSLLPDDMPPVIDDVEEEIDPADAPMSFSDDDDREESDMDMTPMVDVTFLLLIFFMVTAAFSMQLSVPMPVPQDQAPSTNTVEDMEDNPDFVRVFVDSYNTFHVVTVDWEEEAPSEHDLFRQLKRAMEVDEAPTKMMVTSHNDSLWDKTVAAMDSGTKVGIREISVVMTDEDYE